MKRLWVPLFLIFALYAVVILRLGQLQLIMHRPLKAKSISEVIEKKRVRPLRARILDRKGRVLAVTVARPSIFVSFKELEVSRQTAWSLLTRAVPSADWASLGRRWRSAPSFFWVKRLADPSEGQAVERLKLRGFGIEEEQKRGYPHDGLAREVLGDVNLDGEGSSGVERQLNPLLRGEEKTQLVLRDALGRVFAEDDNFSMFLRKTDADEPGPFDVYLTLDAELTKRVEENLEEALRRHEAQAASAVVYEIKTGAILAISSRGRPGDNVDPNLAVSYTFEPGSVIKPFVIAAGLRQGVVRETDEIDCENGRYSPVRGLTIEDHEPQSVLRLGEVLAHSSNVGLSKIAMKIGAPSLFFTLRAFGFGSKAAIPMTGEAAGILRSPQDWTPMSLPMMSFGYEIGVTLLQLTQAYGALANGGVMLEPQIVGLVTPYRNKRHLYHIETRKVRSALPKDIANRTLALMSEVVDYGTGQAAQIPGYSVAGKTGTAQKLDPKTGKHSTQNVIVSFCGVFPAADPKIAVCTMLDNPRKPKVAWASDLAVPLFKTIAQHAIVIMGVVSTAPQNS
ncbi:MAG: penicillin-binding protein 2 [Elusimicrobia bacterium]|nr:penicillin-binding protein 2 [Elusimicrobiota bacterium]